MRTEPKDIALFVLAHQDDEFFCLPFISRALAEGKHVKCVYLTNGGYGGQPIDRRITESLKVLQAVGIDAANVTFLGVQEKIPDGLLHLHAAQVFVALRSFCQRNRPSQMFVPAWEGGHQDHDVCHALALYVSISLGLARPKQFPLYHGNRSKPLFRVMSYLTSNGNVEFVHIGLKQALRNLATAFAYPSQWKTWLGLLPFAAWKILFTRTYTLQPTDVSRLSYRPHEGQLLYERRGFCAFDSVAACIEEIRSISAEAETYV